MEGAFDPCGGHLRRRLDLRSNLQFALGPTQFSGFGWSISGLSPFGNRGVPIENRRREIEWPVLWPLLLLAGFSRAFGTVRRILPAVDFLPLDDAVREGVRIVGVLVRVAPILAGLAWHPCVTRQPDATRKECPLEKGEEKKEEKAHGSCLLRTD